MAVKAISDYKFPSKSREELYGGAMLVHMWWKNNPWFCAAACFPLPKTMTWGDFINGPVKEFFSEDPDWSDDTSFSYTLHGKELHPNPEDTLEGLGIWHKSVVAMTSA
jgi:Phenol hydroxylase conserved region.